MKIRNGFVSNSSSSSFIVTFPHHPTSKEDLASMMGDCSPTNDYYPVSSDDVVSAVWKEIDGQPSGGIHIRRADKHGECHWQLETLFRALCDSDKQLDIVMGGYFKLLDFLNNGVISNDSLKIAPEGMTIEEMLSKFTNVEQVEHEDLDNWSSWLADETAYWDDGSIKKVAFRGIKILIGFAAGNSYYTEMFDTLLRPESSSAPVYYFEFSDNDGPFWAAMEHGNVFRNVDFTRESHH